MKKLIFLLLFFPLFCKAQIVKQPIYLQQDKQIHFISGALISETVYFYTLKKTNDKTKATIYAFGSTLAVAILKETYDVLRKSPNGFELTDIWATMAGSVIMIPILKITL